MVLSHLHRVLRPTALLEGQLYRAFSVCRLMSDQIPLFLRELDFVGIRLQPCLKGSTEWERKSKRE